MPGTAPLNGICDLLTGQPALNAAIIEHRQQQILSRLATAEAISRRRYDRRALG